MIVLVFLRLPLVVFALVVLALLVLLMLMTGGPVAVALSGRVADAEAEAECHGRLARVRRLCGGRRGWRRQQRKGLIGPPIGVPKPQPLGDERPALGLHDGIDHELVALEPGRPVEASPALGCRKVGSPRPLDVLRDEGPGAALERPKLPDDGPLACEGLFVVLPGPGRRRMPNDGHDPEGKHGEGGPPGVPEAARPPTGRGRHEWGLFVQRCAHDRQAGGETLYLHHSHSQKPLQPLMFRGIWPDPSHGRLLCLNDKKVWRMQGLRSDLQGKVQKG